MRLGRVWKGFLAVLAGLGLAGAPAQALQTGKPAASAPSARAPATAARAAEPRPAIWLLEDRDTKIYLFGTTHVFERGFRWRSARLNTIIAEADELVLETNDNEPDEDAVAAMYMPKPDPILERVSGDRRDALAALLSRSDLPMEAWDRMHSYAAAFLLYGLVMAEVGPDKGEEPVAEMSGAEIELTEEFQRLGRPISGVETMEQQLEVFRSMPAETQRAFLESIVDASATPYEEAGLAGDPDWASGNLAAMEAELADMPRELYDALLAGRNRNWAEWLQQRLERPGTVLFAVGAGHFVGRDSLHDMLARRGLRARRID
jgi:uncharacterized protein YbaP (TraB family)